MMHAFVGAGDLSKRKIVFNGQFKQLCTVSVHIRQRLNLALGNGRRLIGDIRVSFATGHNKSTAHRVITTTQQTVSLSVECRQVHGVGVKRTNLVGRENHVAVRIKGNTLDPGKIQQMIFFSFSRDLYGLPASHGCRSLARQAKKRGLIGSVPATGRAKASHQLTDHALRLR